MASLDEQVALNDPSLQQRDETAAAVRATPNAAIGLGMLVRAFPYQHQHCCSQLRDQLLRSHGSFVRLQIFRISSLGILIYRL
jgi:hypothetical protein